MIDIPASYRRRFGIHAERVAERLVRTYGHLAVALAREIYDEPGDLGPDETTFLIEVNAADRIMARPERDGAYQAALDKYELMIFRREDDDEDDAHPALVAAE